MMTGSYSLTQQVGSKGYFAKMSVAVESTDSIACEVEFSEAALCEWTAGAAFGITHAWEIYLLSNPPKKGLKVKVLEIEGHFIDTTNLVVAYAGAMAVWAALGWHPTKPLSFDPKTGFFGFWKF